MKRKETVSIIKEILKKRNSNLLDTIQSLTDVNKISRDIREEIVNELSDELCENGLQNNSEPNDYGLMIENLIDQCHISEF